MTNRFDGAVALVTGGSSGIGRATAIAFAREGAKVLVADLGEAGGQETVRLIREAGGDAMFVKTDVSSAADAEAMVARAVETYGRLDIAYNNAGIVGQSTPAADGTEENWDRVIDVNLKGIFLCMKAEIPRMLSQGGGAIVNCASVAGLVGFAGIAPYVASKHGVVGLTKAAALDYATLGIRINAVCPGVIRTPMVTATTQGDAAAEAALAAGEPIGRIGEPEEIADAVLWLCSPGASFVTGEAIAVDGGWIAR